MDTEYVDAVNQLEDEVNSAVARVEETLTNAEIASELRRIADMIAEGMD